MEVLGKILIFISFFLVAPELLSEGKLKDYLERKETSIIGFLAACVGLFGLLAVVYVSVRFWLHVDLTPAVVGKLITGRDAPGDVAFNQTVGQSVAAVCLSLALVAARLLRDVVDDLVVKPVVERAAKDAGYRSRLVGRGAWCFVIGSLLDLAGSLK